MVYLLIDIAALTILHLITPVNIKLIRLRLVIRIIGLIHDVGIRVAFIRLIRFPKCILPSRIRIIRTACRHRIVLTIRPLAAIFLGLGTISTFIIFESGIFHFAFLAAL